jgi:hypothetical protein
MLIRNTIITLTALTVINAYADKINIKAVGRNIPKCHVDHRCYLKGSHDIEIINESNDAHKYKYVHVLCALKGDWRTDCHVYENNMVVMPHSTWTNHYDSHASPRFSIHMTYDYLVQTNVFGDQIEKVENKYSVRVKD